MLSLVLFLVVCDIYGVHRALFLITTQSILAVVNTLLAVLENVYTNVLLG